ncbi:winged helix family transcriptional regulator [Cryptosporangium aurantiacum]|uniref:Transcriptional regulatory protein, C terminal n=1 Tax=Cryptosporangium aurantiacum TaxID=134849 RepID=A0A1M7MWM6_9ACTN|nr:winged helix family transcriptional regulator [Cryptosporangium aurantiacum]SHM95445.1 Transcriptional regulatory protein, C terminal [Cryptosporangium aurantiacum]
MTVQPVTQNARPRIAPQRPSPNRAGTPRPAASVAPGRARPRGSASPSAATILVEVAVAGPDALEAATRLAGEIRDLVDSAGAEAPGIDVSAAVGLQIGAGSNPSRAGRPALSSVGTLPSQNGRVSWTPGTRPGSDQAKVSSPVPLPAFVAPAPWSAEPRPAEPRVTETSGAVAVAAVDAAPRPATSPDATAAEQPAASTAPLQIYPARRVALLDGQQLLLTRREFDLLLFLSEHAGRVFDRPQLLRLVWGHQVICGERTVDVHIRRLRAKVEQTGPVISTVRGVGYRLDAAERVAVLHERA